MQLALRLAVRLAVLALLPLALPAAQRAALVVDAGAAPGSDYPDLASAVQAAADGDLILLRNGFYGDLVIAGKALTVQAELPGSAFVERVVVRDTTAAQRVFLRGLHLSSVAVQEHGILIEDCAGPVWVEDLEPFPPAEYDETYATSLSQARVVSSADVVFAHCDLDWTVPEGIDGVELIDSATRLFHTHTPNCDGRNSAVRVRGGTLGFHGGDMQIPGCFRRGKPLILEDGADAVFQPGVPSNLPVEIVAGTLTELASYPRSHRSSSPVLEGGTVEVELRGRENDLVWVLVSPALTTPASVLGSHSPLFLDAPIQSVFVGQIPVGESSLELAPRIGNLGPGGVAFDFLLQGVFLRPGAPGVNLTEPTVVSLLDAGLEQPVYLFADEALLELTEPGTHSFGRRMTVADVNGDGFQDLLVADPGYGANPGSFFSYSVKGALYLFPGEPGGFASTPTWSQIRETQSVEPNPQGLGTHLATAGDLNGDGFEDVVVTDNGFPLYVGYGSATGLPAEGIPAHYFTGSGWSFRGLTGEVGDVDGDGFADLVLLQNCGFNCESARLFAGSPAGLDFENAAWELPFPTSGGNRVHGIGDVNADGYADFVVSERVSAAPHRASLYLGSSAGPTLAWNQGVENLIQVLGPGDVDGDGFDDLVIGAEFELRVHLGDADGPAAAPDQIASTRFYGWPSATRFDEGELVRVGDVDGDGLNDVGFFGTRPGSYWSILRGSPQGLTSAPYWELPMTSSGETFAVYPDTNGDGRPELLHARYDLEGFAPGVVDLFPSLP